MSSLAISLLDLEADNAVCLEADDYQTRPGKWCAGCGDFGALNAVKRLLPRNSFSLRKWLLYRASAVPAASLTTSMPMVSMAFTAGRYRLQPG